MTVLRERFSPEDYERTLRDLIGLLALPTLCHGRSREEVASTLGDVIRALIPNELTYVRVGQDREAVEVTRPADRAERVAAIRELLAQAEPKMEPTTIDTYFVATIGFYGDAGVLVVALPDGGPSPRDRIVMRAATSLASSAFENARLLEKIRDADRRKDEFFALLGHELRNPLAPILSAVEVMKQRNHGADPAREVIERQALHMSRLVDDLLDVSRIARGKLVLEKSIVELADVVGRGVEMALPMIERANHTLSVEVPREVFINADPFRIAQVVSNLLTNAARYTPNGGRIAVVASPSGSRVSIAVRDTGRGIAADMLARIFEPFVQVDRRNDALVGGLGIGLTIVRTLVELHGGRITAHSDGPGQGSEFTVELLTCESPERASKPVVEDSTSKPRRVMIVDDNRDAADLLAAMLETRGHEVVVADTAAGALRAAEQFTPDIALLDIGLPDATGYELCEQLRDRFGTTIRLVALTGYGDETARTKSRRAGFDHHMVKPVKLAVLYEAIDA